MNLSKWICTIRKSPNNMKFQQAMEQMVPQ